MSEWQDLLRVALPTCAATTALRYTINRYICGARWGKQTPKGKAATLTEESWLMVMSTTLLVLSTWAIQRHNGGCTLTAWDSCLRAWPQQETSSMLALVFAVHAGWYTHGLIKSLIPGIGLHAGLDMVGHHIVTCGLLVASDVFHVKRMGFLILALLNFSNPFMHVAKVLYYAGAPKAMRNGCFFIFACVFFVSRCLLFPCLLLYILAEVRRRQLNNEHDAVVAGVFSMLGLGALQILQFFWMVRIVRVIKRGGDSASSKAHAKPEPADEHSGSSSGSAITEEALQKQDLPRQNGQWSSTRHRIVDSAYGADTTDAINRARRGAPRFRACSQPD